MQLTINTRHEGDLDLPTLADVMSRKPGSHTITAQSAYRYLANIEEFPEMLPLAYQIVSGTIDASKDLCSMFPAEFYEERAGAISCSGAPEYLGAFSKSFGLDVLSGSGLDHGRNGHLTRLLTPTILVTGCWLQNLSRVATAHTTVAGELARLFSMQTAAYPADDVQNEDQAWPDIFDLFAIFRELNSPKKFVHDENAEDRFFEFPLLLLSIGQFPREYLPELLGLNMAWHHLGIQNFVERITLGCLLESSLPDESFDKLRQRSSAMAGLSLRAVETFCSEQDPAGRFYIWRRILCGMEMLSANWMKWVNGAKAFLQMSDPDPRAEMVKLIRSKRPYALGYHRHKRLGPHKIDELLDIGKSDLSEVVDWLARSPYVVPGDAAKSPFATRLVELGGPMTGIFSGDELKVVCNWINSLDMDKTREVTAGEITSHQSTVGETDGSQSGDSGKYPLWERADFLEEAREGYAGRSCSLRELYFKLVNIEYFPDVLPVAEQFLLDRLNWSMSTLISGERPLPDAHYSYEVLRKWVFDKHRQQVDSYQPFTGKPRVSRETFIDSTVALAPLLLIDGAWLQGVTGVNTIHSQVGRKLFHVFFEELGVGAAEHHHANTYRDMLESMGVDLPDVTSLDFAFSERFQDAAFKVPVLWLSISCFTRHYLPEILGLNLAVELAGLGGGYMEAHDTLKHYGFPTVFVDIHNSADNASVGHTAWALDAIKSYMNAVTERDGPHNLDAHWHRIWAGMRLTLPETSDFYWNPAHRSMLSPERMVHPVPAAIFYR